ncbi:MAG: precorrin-3B synthase [Pseudanabaenaceae cyanobacterium bins.68]|nr:precorrin-3B synthase [Pseudanabaenaceae cyanobacterium bins.68]
MSACPGLFAPVVAKDGNLSRLRIPGGRLNVSQIQVIAQLTGQIQITNRANLQIRGQEISWTRQQHLQELGLAHPQLDHLRNLMVSPMAGLDPQAIFDPWALVLAWQDFTQAQPELAQVSPKFSVGFDGGEQMAITGFTNDLLLSAEILHRQVYLRLYICGVDGEIVILPSQAIATLAAFTQVYGEYCQAHRSHKTPRLRDLIDHWGLGKYLGKVNQRLDLEWAAAKRQPLALIPGPQPVGIYVQKDGNYAIGVGATLGNLSGSQFLGIGAIAATYGTGEIRLTPWQNLLVPGLGEENLPLVQQELARLELSYDPQAIAHRISACVGSQGCSAALSDTWADAQLLIKNLEDQSSFRDLTIHLSGCHKLCGRNSPKHLTLVATGQGQYQAELNQLD